MSKSWLMGIALLLSFLSTMVLTFVTVREPAMATTIKCLYAEVTPGQGTISANQYGRAIDTYVYDVYASTGYQPSYNVVIDIENVSNIQTGGTSVATPSSYNLFATGGGSSDSVSRAWRQVGVDIQLTTITQDGTFDAVIKADETGGIQDPDGNTTNVNVDTYYD